MRSFFLIDCKKDPAAQELESLDERSVHLIVIDGVHLAHEDLRVFLHISLVVSVGASPEICAVFTLLVLY